MENFTKQRFPDCLSATGTSGWNPTMAMDQSAIPGTVIRPDMPLGSGPAKAAAMPENPITRSQELPIGPCPWMSPRKKADSDTKDDSDRNRNCNSMKCPARSKEPIPMKCPERKRAVAPARCPGAVEPISMRRPEMPVGHTPAKCPRSNPFMSDENIDQFPVGMAYVPWQKWQQVYSIDYAFTRGTIFPDLDKPFLMEGCRR